MRTVPLTLVLAIAAFPALAQGPSGPKPVQTTAQANRDGLTGAAQAPLRDLNVVRVDVPPVLVNALADPYRRPPSTRCADLIAQLRPLNDALGDDIDQPSAVDESLGGQARPAAYGAMASVASDALIPFRGVVRYVTGANKHDQYVQSAIIAGYTRRAYLKGLGEARSCRPPATPSHAMTEIIARQQAHEQAATAASPSPQPPAQNSGGGRKPRYPVR
ncbi:hypothetical protein [Phenylobacterium immobile]|uniref:hypothetical protein n=1 Tax=Phenylobacterium immobile TaxID=21 RepID=UPI000A57901A|nr:hypothetical protein [Phenylobacterium immobile]